MSASPADPAHSAAVENLIKHVATHESSYKYFKYTYIYSHLTERDSIRLLNIQPANDIDADLHLRITHTTLSNLTASNGDPLEFIALSYFWGLQLFRKPVYIESGDGATGTTKLIDDESWDMETERCATQRREDLEKLLGEMPLATLLAYGKEAEQIAADNSRRAAQHTCTNVPNTTSTPKLHIGANLHSALRHLRKRNTEVIVWADGLCIDQRDISERNHQVFLMREIYQRASKTVAYIGDELGNTSISAWNFLERTAAGEGDEGRHITQYFKGDLGDVEIDVLSRPWFRRVWVVQEVAVSTNIIVQCGQRSISWDDFCKVVLLEPRVNDRYGMSLSNKELYENVMELFLTRCAFQLSCGRQHHLPSWYNAIGYHKIRGNYVLDTVARSRHLEATDPKDKIFALLGISSGVDPGDPRIAVDYSKTLRRVYEDFARYTIDAGHNLDVLSYCTRGTLGSDWLELDWPTWVPDWRQTMPISRSILRSVPLRVDGGQDRQPRSPEMNYRWVGNEDHLQCSGMIIGQLDEVSPTLQLTGKDELAFEQIRLDCGANVEKMKAQILERWKTYPWNNELSKKYQTSQEHASSFKLQPTHWDGLWLDSELGSRHLYARMPLGPRIRERLTWGLREQPMSNESNEEKSNIVYHPPSSRIVLEHLIQRSRQTLIWTDDESTALKILRDGSSVIDNRRLGLMLRQDAESERIILKPNMSSSQMRSIRGDISADPDPPSQHQDRYTLTLLPENAMIGDYVVSLVGARVPFVIRAIPSDDESGLTRTSLVGECLVDEEDISGLGPRRDTNMSSPLWPLQDFALGLYGLSDLPTYSPDSSDDEETDMNQCTGY